MFCRCSHYSQCDETEAQRCFKFQWWVAATEHHSQTDHPRGFHAELMSLAGDCTAKSMHWMCQSYDSESTMTSSCPWVTFTRRDWTQSASHSPNPIPTRNSTKLLPDPTYGFLQIFAGLEISQSNWPKLSKRILLSQRASSTKCNPLNLTLTMRSTAQGKIRTLLSPIQSDPWINPSRVQLCDDLRIAPCDQVSQE